MRIDMSVRDTLSRLSAEWAEPRRPVHHGRGTSAPVVCSVKELRNTTPFDSNVPPDVATFWGAYDGARLFVDTQYGQWGLVLHGPAGAKRLTDKFRAQRARDAAPGDLVLGEFLGDSELLVVRADPTAEDYNVVMIALPLDPRSDWSVAADSLGTFLEKYDTAQGAKFWET